jgi:nucleotide-binding universal stress UspA family protein
LKGNLMEKRAKLLIGYDGSENGDAAIEDIQRAGLPRDVDAVVLTVADVWYYPADEEAKVTASSPLDREILRRGEEIRLRSENAVKEAETLASRAVARLRELSPSWEIRAETTINWPAWGIITRAEEWGADLVVVGSGGRSFMDRIRFGSISRKVVEACACSVRVARPSAMDGSIRVLIGVDGSPDAELAIDAVCERMWPPRSEARLITVLDNRLAFASPSLLPTLARWSGAEDDHKHEAWVHRMMQAASEKLQTAGLTTSTVISTGDPRQAVVDAAREWKANSIFLGARGLSGIERFLIGSVSSSVAARAPCSVEVVRRPAARP